MGDDMTPPEDKGPGIAAAPEAPSAVLLSVPDRPVVSVSVIAKRTDFLKAAAARRQGTGSFLLQARNRQDDTRNIRIGFTASKKIGNAVTRNRAKRRMRAVARAVLPGQGLPGWDYVLVARPEATVARTFTDLLADLTTALASVHRAKP